MNHKHVGPPDVACTGCFAELQAPLRAQRRKTIAGVVILIALVVAGMGLLSWYLNDHGPHLR